MRSIFLENFATTYNCNTYGAGTYDSQASCSTASNGLSGSNLVDTGVSVVLPIALGIVLIGSAIVLLVKGKKKQTKK